MSTEIQTKREHRIIEPGTGFRSILVRLSDSDTIDKSESLLTLETIDSLNREFPGFVFGELIGNNTILGPHFFALGNPESDDVEVYY